MLWALKTGILRQMRLTWLCVTHKGVRRVNLAALRCLKDSIGADMLVGEGYPGDPSVSAGNIILRVGLRLRVSRNLDKPRGFVNGALGTIKVSYVGASRLFSSILVS